MQVGAGIDQAHKLQGGSRGDKLSGGGADNSLHSNGGDDLLIGDGGDEKLYAGTGDDILIGGDCDDNLYGAWDNDTLRGGACDNLIVLGPGGEDVVVWGKGDHIGFGSVLTFQTCTDSLEFELGFLAKQRATGDVMDGLLEATSQDGATVLQANTAQAGWQNIAQFQGLSVGDLESVIANDASIIA